MRIALIFNPTAGASLLARQNISKVDLETELCHFFRNQGIEPEVYHTTLEDPGEKAASQLADEHVELVVAVGGDGTVHAVAHGLIGSASVLGIIPAGTMNNLAYSLGIPEDLKEACAILLNGEVRCIDVGRINHHFFLEVAGVGLETALYPAAEAVKIQGFLSTIKGVFSGLYTLMNFHPAQMSITFDTEKPRTYRAIQVTVCNSPYYGVHLNIAPGIAMNDGWLDAVVYTNFSKSDYIRHAIAIIQGRRLFTPKIIYRRVKLLRIRASRAIELHADGTVFGNTPAKITIRPGALQVQVPKKPVPGLLPEKKEPARCPTTI